MGMVFQGERWIDSHDHTPCSLSLARARGVNVEMVELLASWPAFTPGVGLVVGVLDTRIVEYVVSC